MHKELQEYFRRLIKGGILGSKFDGNHGIPPTKF